jgi:hypothetical protein
MKPVCFFSHCWDNDTRLIHYLKEEVERKSNNRVEIIFDKDSFLISDDLIQCEKKIVRCDSVVVFFSPEYKKIITESQINRGVYREYKYIKEMKDNVNKSVIPVIVKGDKTNAVPDDFINIIFENLTGVKVFNNNTKRKSVTKSFKSRVDKFIDIIINRTEAKYNLRTYEFSNDIEMYENLLYITSANKKLPRDCMIKLDAYDSIISQRSCFIIGRKGSGKTTFFETLEKYDPKFFQDNYKSLIPINAEYINLEIVYATLKEYDIDKNIISKSKLLSVFWETYFILSVMHIVGIDEERNKILDDRRHIFQTISNRIKTLLSVSELDSPQTQEGLFIMSIEQVDKFLKEHLLDKTNIESYLASTVANTTVTNVMHIIFGEELYKDFLSALERCTKRIFIALDGFDTISEDFRMHSNWLLKTHIAEGNDRIEFERLFYRNLINVTDDIVKRKKAENVNQLFSNIDFCLVMPKDRIDQIETIDRDISKISFNSLSWSAIDLLNLLVLRLEYIYKIPTNSGKDLINRFNHIIDEYLPSIPKNLQIEINGHIKNIELFQYMLRLSFWRPRDLLSHLAQLFYIEERNKSFSLGKVDNEIVKDILNKNAEQIVKKEFFIEYSKVFLNLPQVLSNFENDVLIYDFNSFYQKLSGINFETVFAFDCTKTENKIRLLYELGIIGFFLREDSFKRSDLRCPFCYYFNEGLKPLELIKKQKNFENENYKFILNPIFAKFLSIEINTDVIVNNFSWEYLNRNHITKQTLLMF